MEDTLRPYQSIDSLSSPLRESHCWRLSVCFHDAVSRLNKLKAILQAYIVDTVSADQRTEDIIDWLPHSKIPNRKILIPASRVEDMRILWVLVKLDAINTHGMPLEHEILLSSKVCILNSLDCIPHTNLIQCYTVPQVHCRTQQAWYHHCCSQRSRAVYPGYSWNRPSSYWDTCQTEDAMSGSLRLHSPL